jgi:excisionase family DNA binding protein
VATDTFLTPSEAARILGVSVHTIRGWCDKGKLASERYGGGRLVSAAAVKKLRTEREKASA